MKLMNKGFSTIGEFRGRVCVCGGGGEGEWVYDSKIILFYLNQTQLLNVNFTIENYLR
jgi:hypothetical protein